ncbi:MAG: GNAT family N-acetyltransferase [Chloroflexia bacterium]|nr:GNAT family N-acetyltransferase [Chloroflexia bacterium]
MARYWEGKLIRLRGVEPTDVDGHYEVDQEDDISRFQWVMNPPTSRTGTEAWVQGAAKERPKGHEFTAQMETLEDGKLVGSIATHHSDQRAGVFSYGLHVEQQYRGKGYASDAICLILRYFFQELRYQKCNVEAMEINPGSQRLHEKLGFQTEGRRRRVVYTYGKHSDLIEYGMTLEEFRDQHPDYWREE